MAGVAFSRTSHRRHLRHFIFCFETRTGADTGWNRDASAGFGLANLFAREFMSLLDGSPEHHFKPSTSLEPAPESFSPNSVSTAHLASSLLAIALYRSFWTSLQFLAPRRRPENHPSLAQFTPVALIGKGLSRGRPMRVGPPASTPTLSNRDTCMVFLGISSARYDGWRTEVAAVHPFSQ